MCVCVCLYMFKYYFVSPSPSSLSPFFPPFPLSPATACQLYKATQSTYSNPPPFDSSLGVFMPNSFALSYQYMFVQVRYTVLFYSLSLPLSLPLSLSLSHIQRNYTDTGRPSGGYASPLWVSNYRKPFKAASFSLQLEERVSNH